MILLKNLIKNYLLGFHGTFIHQIMPIIKTNFRNNVQITLIH